MFLAISIFDSYLQKSYQEWLAEAVNSNLYAIVCFLLAWKFQGDSHPSLESLRNYLSISTPTQIFQKEILELQQKILLKLDFVIPSNTAY